MTDRTAADRPRSEIVSHPEYISPAEAAFIAGVSPKTIRDWASKIERLGVKRVGRWTINRRHLNFILAHGVDQYLGRLAALRAAAHETNETHETHETNLSHDCGTSAA